MALGASEFFMELGGQVFRLVPITGSLSVNSLFPFSKLIAMALATQNVDFLRIDFRTV